MHGIGHFYIIVRAAEASSGLAYAELPGELLASAHPQIGRTVLTKWGFESVVCEAVCKQYDYGRQSPRAADLTDVLIASVALAEALLYRSGELSGLDKITAVARLNLSEDGLQAVLKHTELSLEAMRDVLAG